MGMSLDSAGNARRWRTSVALVVVGWLAVGALILSLTGGALQWVLLVAMFLGGAALLSWLGSRWGISDED
jgi:hypothetical protein